MMETSMAHGYHCVHCGHQESDHTDKTPVDENEALPGYPKTLAECRAASDNWSSMGFTYHPDDLKELEAWLEKQEQRHPHHLSPYILGGQH